MSKCDAKRGREFYLHVAPRGVWGHAPPGRFGIFDGLRLLLEHSQHVSTYSQ